MNVEKFCVVKAKHEDLEDWATNSNLIKDVLLQYTSSNNGCTL